MEKYRIKLSAINEKLHKEHFDINNEFINECLDFQIEDSILKLDVAIKKEGAREYELKCHIYGKINGVPCDLCTESLSLEIDKLDTFINVYDVTKWIDPKKSVSVIASILSKLLKYIRVSGLNKDRILQIKMEDICSRFPHLAEEIMKQIDYQSLTNCKLANRDICKFLNKGRFLWKQIILKSITGNCPSVFK